MKNYEITLSESDYRRLLKSLMSSDEDTDFYFPDGHKAVLKKPANAGKLLDLIIDWLLETRHYVPEDPVRFRWKRLRMTAYYYLTQAEAFLTQCLVNETMTDGERQELGDAYEILSEVVSSFRDQNKRSLDNYRILNDPHVCGYPTGKED